MITPEPPTAGVAPSPRCTSCGARLAHHAVTVCFHCQPNPDGTQP
jgi:predicted RNA-binding Zn-ribbon protein involved in translation (DUF1610 family)